MIVSLQFLFTNCFKTKKVIIPPDIHCNSAQVCIGNLTRDTIFYGWNCNYYTDTLLPNKSACINIGPVNVVYDKTTGELTSKQSYTEMLNSSRGSWFINVETCNRRSNFEYDNTNPSNGVILLYAQ